MKLGAYLIESRLGRKWSLAGSTFITAFFCAVFALVQSSWAVRASTVGVSLSATVRCLLFTRWPPVIDSPVMADDVGRVIWVSCLLLSYKSVFILFC